TSTGNSLMWLNAEVDEGSIIDQRPIPITPFDTCKTLYDKVAETNRDMILGLVDKLTSGERPCAPQPTSDEPLLPRRRPADGKIAWDGSATATYDFIRALTLPYPGAFSWLDGKKWMVWNAALLPGHPEQGVAPGTVIGPVISPVAQACGQAVACGDGAVVLLELADDEGNVLSGPELAEQRWA